MALPQSEVENRQFNPEEYPDLYHICGNKDGKISYGSIMKNMPFYIIGEGGKETEVGRYDICTRCRKVLKLNFNNKLNQKYKVNIHKCFMENDSLTFLYKHEVLNGYLDPEFNPKPQETFKGYKSRFQELLKRFGYNYIKNNEKPLKS